ncbi:unnamed protein product [Strongylus vulgaris]|uniref:Uncharacterized protein n=1 Tax=Strongylus vulgaris TaxID=40348 RepID=A0A3P7IQI6_STRVU|nr:unnamed protein product [Strongylus vulgaris]
MLKRPLIKRSCYLCGRYTDERLLRRTTPNSHHTVVLLSSLVLFNALDLEKAKRCYEACLKIRQRLCDQHYIDAAQFISSEMACLGIGFTTYVDEPRGVVVSYVNEKDVPLHLTDTIDENAKKLNARLTITGRKVSEFLNFCLSRYQVDGIRAATGDQEDDADVKESIKEEMDIKPVALLCGKSKSSELIVVGPDHSTDSSSANQETVEKLDETDPELLKKDFTIKGKRLLSLFRFCPNCGTKIRARKGQVKLIEKDSSPVVYYLCNGCPGKQCWYGISNVH